MTNFFVFLCLRSRACARVCVCVCATNCIWFIHEEINEVAFSIEIPFLIFLNNLKLWWKFFSHSQWAITTWLGFLSLSMVTHKYYNNNKFIKFNGKKSGWIMGVEIYYQSGSISSSSPPTFLESSSLYIWQHSSYYFGGRLTNHLVHLFFFNHHPHPPQFIKTSTSSLAVTCLLNINIPDFTKRFHA